MALFKKKSKNETLETFRDITDDVIEADFVPYACHWDPHTIVTKNGELLQTIQLTGIGPAGSADDDDIDIRAVLREVIQDCVNSTHYAVWVHTVRRRTNWQAGGNFKRDFAGHLDRFWQDKHRFDAQFSNEIYVTVVREGEAAKLTAPKDFVRGIISSVDKKHRERFLNLARDKLNNTMEKLLSQLAPYGAHRLGIVKRGETYYSEPCAFLGKLITLLDIDYPVSDISIAHYLTDYDVTFGFNAMEVRMRKDGNRRFGAMLTLKDYRELSPELLDRILQMPCEFIISQCFDFVSAKLALKEFNYQQALFDISKAGALAESTGLADIMNSNQNKPTDYGAHQLTFFLLADSLKTLESAVLTAVEAFSALGMVPMREDIKFEECYWSQLPANFEFIRRVKPLNTARIGGFANITHMPIGQLQGNKWGAAVTTFYTVEGAPYFFNFHAGDTGHTLLVGPPDAGGMILLNFLLAQAQKFSGKTLIFDNERQSEIFVRSLDGDYLHPRGTEGAAPALPNPPFSLNPFAIPGTPENRAFLRDWVMLLADLPPDAARDASMLQTLRDHVEKAVAATFDAPKDMRHVAYCLTHIVTASESYMPLFADFLPGGTFHTLFSATDSLLASSASVRGIETGALLTQGRAGIAQFFYMLHLVMLGLDGKPILLVLNEAWQFLAHPFFAPRVGAWLERLAAKNAVLVLVTAHPEALLQSALLPVIMPYIKTQLFLPDEEAGADHMRGLGLSDKEVSYIAVLSVEDGHFLVKQRQQSAVCELNLKGMHDILSVLQATPKNLATLQRVMAQYGPQAAKWMPKFLELL